MGLKKIPSGQYLKDHLSPDEKLRYSRQILLEHIGTKGQINIRNSSVVIIGTGATGCAHALFLTRLGIGSLTIIDRDIVDLSNLPRQVLFTENDVGRSKVEAAREHLTKINEHVSITAITDDVNADNILTLVEGHDLILDGTDNLQTRYLINDVSYQLGIPWIYTGAVSTQAMTLTIDPRRDGACFRCLFPDPASPGTLMTCDTAGVLGTIPTIISGMAINEAIKVLINPESVKQDLLVMEFWTNDFMKLKATKQDNCPTCHHHRFDFLSQHGRKDTITLCGRNAVQVNPPIRTDLDLELIASHLEKVGTVNHEKGILTFSPDGNGIEIILFSNGRAIIKGVEDEGRARAIYARYIAI